ncbi:YlcI/YnfO family protein [Anaerotruncus massiliensis (ex Togo et al. 2019)]|jgi:hypothetical protein|nr:YlcI/YnfO family protein [Anaerotruncus massiliensis (ex Togo et al. 2019)]GKH47935.1 hypothetical protein CE91St45_24970 [Oscillospiraceae bacterium]
MVIAMFQITRPEYISKTFRLPKELLRQMEETAQRQGVSLNSLVVQCCDYALRNLERETSPE